ncbi:hypothetical protein SPRG_05225 [Saprolegnia parasitica CBS 223.65]|uniref:Uncharacterized protein n=1 Tax=Saprolegnia parasitica (strain CBS 223.65) TaxID=695850 RepID=A0A067CLE2_SAPPC|nr:hypothetical protein SPRG_05225 [Saprolegnia parasitica CBS 223.65]KDO30035.1 hypothetical protein SPRG_05225 [Saprolegnia parasitica CBS 223.65]|eukprot:XP_012199217.1 hypothetical protein SPRG_05225 [Saprolegnia parasitica CBS 223.65]
MHDARTLSGFCDFLSTTIVALATPASSLQKPAWASTAHCTHAELVDQAIGIALQRKRKDWKKHPNLITLGFTSGYESDANHFTLHAHNVMHHSPNSLVSLLKSVFCPMEL